MTTQNCAECGTPAEPGQSFCDACGAVLRWDQAGARTAQPATASAAGRDAAGPAAAPAGGGHQATATAPGGADAPNGDAENNPTVPQPRRAASAPDPGTPDTGAAAAGAAGGGAAGAGRPADADAAPAAPTASSPSAPAPSRTPDTDETAPTTPVAPVPAPNALTDTMSDRARSLLVPVADPEARTPAPPPGIAPVLPGRPDADRPQVRAPGHVDIANGPPCPWCSTPNRPDRHYCARCAMPLVAGGDQAAVRAPWWRRLFGGTRRETPWAGDRPRLRRVFDRIGTWITVVVVVTLTVLGFMYIPDGYQATRDHFAKRAPVSPDGIKASHSYAGHKPELVIDQLSNTWWGPGISQSGKGEWIEATFTEPTRLLDVIITPGVSTRAAKIKESALPHRVKATITMKDGSVKTRDLTLDQGAGGQRRPFRVGEVTKVRFTIESSHAASADKQVAIAEIEFFGPSSANRSS
ncbi:zinc ribbon domain-containing protein [Streptomyces sp. Tu 4128]|uniref:zinc ribbon domain-containing protein n=1 Tax=Streptomyces sp. Tu 4128 TaxID=1120314 RepID=UPI000F043A77|nr:zinc ribbon domain-containing protein [Streptomyces sp. Tu 4128]